MLRVPEKGSGLIVPTKKRGLIITGRTCCVSLPDNTEREPVVLRECGAIKLVKNRTGFVVLNGRKDYPYDSETWAEKRFERLSKIYVPE